MHRSYPYTLTEEDCLKILMQIDNPDSTMQLLLIVHALHPEWGGIKVKSEAAYRLWGQWRDWCKTNKQLGT